MTRAEVERLIAERRCLGCKYGPLGTDISTGFPLRYCATCQQRIDAKPKGTGESQWRKQHQAEGVVNLDRLMGGDE